MKKFLAKISFILSAVGLVLVNLSSYASNAPSTNAVSSLPPGSYLQNCKNCAVKAYSNGYQLTCQCDTGTKTGGFLGFGAKPVYKESNIALSDIANNKGVLTAVAFKQPVAGPFIPGVGPIL